MLESLAARELESLRKRGLAKALGGARHTDISVLDFIPFLTRGYERPSHLAELTSCIERAETESVEVLVSVPPRHSKTETLLHSIAWYLSRHPERTVAYVTYADRLTISKSRFARDYARQAGVTLLPDSQALNEWRTTRKGGALFTSIGGPFTGQGCDLLIVDDPHKDRAEAESQILRDHVYEWFTGTAYSRVEPGGSTIICHTRWHPDDLIGRMILKDQVEGDRKPWEHVFLPAVNDNGEALWPSRWPVSELQKKHETMGEYEWASLFLGQPRPRGGAVFSDVYYYEKLPATYRVGAGVDLAYTKHKTSDFCVIVVMAESEGVYYILDVRREQSTPPEFAKHFRQVKAAYPGSKWLWYTSSTEMGVADLLRENAGFPIRAALATEDKFVRAQPFAAAWKAGKVLVPRDAPWLPEFVSELMNFTGVNDRRDDQVDAGAAAFDVLARVKMGVPRAFPTSFTKQVGGGPVFPQGDKGGGFVW